MKHSALLALLLTSSFTAAQAQGLPREIQHFGGSAFIIEDQGFQKLLMVKYRPTDVDPQAHSLLSGKYLAIKETGSVDGKPVLIIEYQPASYKPEHADVLVWSNGKQWSVEDPYYQLSKRGCMGLVWKITPEAVVMKGPESDPDKPGCTWTPTKGFEMAAAGVVAAPSSSGGVTRSEQNEMQYIDVRSMAAAVSPVLPLWKDRMEQVNATYSQNFTKLAKGENAPGGILWKEFKDGDATVVVSIYHAVDQCEPGPNSSSSDMSWVAGCPVRVVRTDKDGERTQKEGRACFQWFPMRENEPAPSGERSYAAYDPAKGTVALGVTAKGRFEKSCNTTISLR